MIIAKLPKRLNDDWGSGAFEASRAGGKRKHKGIDFKCYPGTEIAAPATGKVTKLGYCYSDDLSYRYVHILDAKGRAHRVFYVEPCVKVGEQIKRGKIIGTAQDVAKRYYNPHEHNRAKPRKKFQKVMDNHIHYEILVKGKPIDPEKR